MADQEHRRVLAKEELSKAVAEVLDSKGEHIDCSERDEIADLFVSAIESELPRRKTGTQPKLTP
jgi:hypothetical protein